MVETQINLASTYKARRADLQSGVRVEVVTVAWMALEAVVGFVAGILAASVLLTSFGFDSLIELVSGGALLWRLRVESRGAATSRIDRTEMQAARVAAVALALLCVYILATASLSLAFSVHAEPSIPGLMLALSGLIIMPVLVWRKRLIADRIGSSALRADAACSLTCAYLSAALLIGLGANAAFGWWWADSVVAVVLLVWLVPETKEAVINVRSGRASCGCCGGSSST